MAVKIALAQYPISEHASPADWVKHVERWVAYAVSKGAQLLVFPEYASMEMVSWFESSVKSDLQKQIEKLQLELPVFMETFRHLSQKHDCIILAPSFPFKLARNYVNRSFVFSPKGEGHQDKWFMTRFENEVWGIRSGAKELTIFEATWGKFGIQTCYDVEFPIGTQLLAANGAELILAPSCTETIQGATRVHVGSRARAMEQQLYVGVSQTINDAIWSPAVDVNYGYAAVYSSPDKGLPKRGVVRLGKAQEPGWLIQKLDFEKNRYIKAEGQVFNSKDMSSIRMSIGVDVKILFVSV